MRRGEKSGGRKRGRRIILYTGKVTDTLSKSDIVGVLCDNFLHMHSLVPLYLSSTRRTKVVKVRTQTTKQAKQKSKIKNKT